MIGGEGGGGGGQNCHTRAELPDTLKYIYLLYVRVGNYWAGRAAILTTKLSYIAGKQGGTDAAHYIPLYCMFFIFILKGQAHEKKGFNKGPF